MFHKYRYGRWRLTPSDGTELFYTIAHYDIEGYDSDDEYETFPERADYDEHDHQIIPPSTALSSDRRFILTSYVPSPKQLLGKKGFATCDADVVISLSPREGDTLLLSSKTLKDSHPIFQAGLTGDWAVNKTATAEGEGEDARLKYRYELELNKYGDAVLVGKRYKQWQDALLGFVERIEAEGLTVFDDDHIQRYFITSHPCDRHREQYRHTQYQVICATAHKIGFAMLCGFPPRLYRYCHSLLNLNNCPHTYTMVVLEVVEWIHMYGSFKRMAPAFERFILKYHDVGDRDQIWDFPHTYLRLATLLESQEIFQLALAYTTKRHLETLSVNVDHRHDELKAGAELAESLAYDYQQISAVTRMSRNLTSTLQRTHNRIMYDTCLEHEHPKATFRFAYTIWRDWYARNGVRSIGRPNGYIIYQIGEGKIKAESVLQEYWQQYYPDGQKPVPIYVKKRYLKRSVESIICQAQHTAQAMYSRDGKFFGPKSIWEPVGNLDFEDYVYPWQVQAAKKPSALTEMLSNVALGDTE